MTKGRFTVQIIFGALAAGSFWGGVVATGLALFSVVGWTWVFVLLGIFLVSLAVAIINFVGMTRNLDQTFNEKSGLFGKFLS